MDHGMQKILIVTQPTRLEELKRKFNTTEQAKFYVECLGADFGDYLLEEGNYHQALAHTRAAAEQFGRVQVIPRGFLPNLILGRDDIVIALGRDGLVANAMKYLHEQSLIGVNPDPQRWDGRLLPFRPGDLRTLLPEVIAGKRPEKAITMARAESRDGQVLYAANDFFLGIRDHRSARYEIEYLGRREYQSSSGVIISTGLGMTGWHASIMAQLRGMAKVFGMSAPTEPRMDWDSRQLRFCVREPYPSATTGTSIVCGVVRQGEELIFRSDMATDGILFSDGILDDAIAFPSGIELRIGVAKRQGRLVV